MEVQKEKFLFKFFFSIFCREWKIFLYFKNLRILWEDFLISQNTNSELMKRIFYSSCNVKSSNRINAQLKFILTYSKWFHLSRYVGMDEVKRIWNVHLKQIYFKFECIVNVQLRALWIETIHHLTVDRIKIDQSRDSRLLTSLEISHISIRQIDNDGNNEKF